MIVHVDLDLCAEALLQLCGVHNRHLQRIEKRFGVQFHGQVGHWDIEGVHLDGAIAVLHKLAHLAEKGAIAAIDLEAVLQDSTDNDHPQDGSRDKPKGQDMSEKQRAMDADKVVTLASGYRQVQGKTANQRRYLQLMQGHDLTIAVGPAGSGKTYLAVAMAVAAFQAQQVEKIILTRPAVEAGEKLGFLPGDLQQKVDPYLRPLFDALTDMLGLDRMQAMMEAGRIEVAPLAYMRGRTLNDAYIILDEAQNTTRAQMKMFLTRLGFASKMVVTGDITQVDLPHAQMSGLLHALKVLEDVDDIAICRLSEKDVVRHQLVEKIVKAYDLHD
ncbi:MAG: PhoH family protein [Zetaproteobacteria bacterium]|nr:PhoH family protein [Zetaproteobacteria bacterium]